MTVELEVEEPGVRTLVVTRGSEELARADADKAVLSGEKEPYLLTVSRVHQPPLELYVDEETAQYLRFTLWIEGKLA